MTVSDPFVVNKRDAHDVVGEPAPPEYFGEESERPYTPAEGLDPEAPYGYMVDRKTGVKRPRKRAGRGVRVVPAEEAESAPQTERPPDRVPGKVKAEPVKTRRVKTPREEPELPPFRAGPIAKGINRLYRKAGKIVKVWDREIGQAIIECTRKDLDPQTGQPDPEDLTVGECWEEIAKVNPRIRRVLLRLIEGGAWSALFMAHAPILLAILMKESVMRRIPVARLAASFIDDSDAADGWESDPADPGQDISGLFAHLTQEDVAQAMAAFNQFMPPAAQQPDVRMNHRPPAADDFGLPDAA